MGASFDIFADYIRDFLDDEELTDIVVGTWVDMAEERFNNELRCWEMIKRAQIMLPDQCVALPDDFLEMVSLRYTGSGLPLRYVSTDAYWRMRSEAVLAGPPTTAITYLDPTTGQMIGPPLHQPAFIDYGSRGPSRLPQAANAYTFVGNSLFVHPSVANIPEGDEDTVPTEIELVYYARVPPLADWALETKPPLLARAPKLYTYATLAASSPYLVEDERSTIWDGNVTALIKSMNDAAHISRVASSPMRVQIRTFG